MNTIQQIRRSHWPVINTHLLLAALGRWTKYAEMRVPLVLRLSEGDFCKMGCQISKCESVGPSNKFFSGTFQQQSQEIFRNYHRTNQK